MSLVVTSKVKQLAKAGGLRTSQEFIDSLSKILGKIIIEAAKKCKSDGKGVTLKAKHLD